MNELRLFCAPTRADQPVAMVHPNPVFRAQVLGAGPTGALAALALARAGWQVRICDPLPASALVERNRA